MSEFRPGVVITTCEGREKNLIEVLKCVDDACRFHPGIIHDVVVIYDGGDPEKTLEAMLDIERRFMVRCFQGIKHKPGLENPRNIGVRALSDHCNAVWFLDSDIIFLPITVAYLKERWEANDLERVIIGPYEWLPEGKREIDQYFYNDFRWTMFNESRWDDLNSYSLEDLSVGLGCFGGNLVWPIAEFKRVGGFWNDLHHGRCEDGELGVRAVAEGVPITIERRARGYHLDHPTNMQQKIERNMRDVPMLDARHPWIQGHGVFVVNKDGKRFDQRCPVCNELINTILFWEHRAQCRSHW